MKNDAQNLFKRMMALAMTGKDAEVGEAMKEFYGSYADDLLLALKSFKPLLEAIGNDSGEVLAMLAASLSAAAENQSLQTEAARMIALKAAARKRKLDAYIKSGFTRAEAMSFILADTAAVQTAIRQAIPMPTKTPQKSESAAK
jgi:hypothetical protein